MLDAADGEQDDLTGERAGQSLTSRRFLPFSTMGGRSCVAHLEKRRDLREFLAEDIAEQLSSRGAAGGLRTGTA
jgi:hypothetical protein